MCIKTMTTSEAFQSYSDCCLSVSQSLVDAVVQVLRDCSELVLSIGSGSGRFEALLADAGQRNLKGVELADVNKHLPSSQLEVVSGVHALCDEAMMATALLFVYPRPTGLILRYMEFLTQGALQKIVVLTHRSDWDELLPGLEALTISTYEEVGGTAAHEIGIVICLG